MRILCLILALSSSALLALCGQAEAGLEPRAAVVAPAGRPVDSGPGIQWQKSLAVAKAMAARTGKPLFLLHLFGKLDEAFC